ncbi:MAG: hypothetical protein ACI8RA_002905, partial [Chlamydiales bacterium]
MATFQLSDNDLEQVSRERYEHPSPMVQKRMTVLYLKHIGMKHKDVAKGAQCSEKVKKGSEKGVRVRLSGFERCHSVVGDIAAFQAAVFILSDTQGVAHGLA